LRLIDLNMEKRQGIIRCTHRYLEQVKECISTARFDPGGGALRVLGVSGTVKTLRRKFLSKQKERLTGGKKGVSALRKGL